MNGIIGSAENAVVSKLFSTLDHLANSPNFPGNFLGINFNAGILIEDASRLLNEDDLGTEARCRLESLSFSRSSKLALVAVSVLAESVRYCTP